MADLKTPNHVAIIMDGNGRWATRRGLSRSKGHLAGTKALEKVAIYAMKKGIKVLSLYAFSTDNFKRSEEEVNYLMNLFVKFFISRKDIFMKNEIKVMFSGRKNPLPSSVIEAMSKLALLTENNTKGILNVCLNYGGQEEIVDATKKIIVEVNGKNLNIEDLNRETFGKYLYNDLPPIDLLIRTGGEYRISNFMLYLLSYSEFYFTDVWFPDFDNKELDKAVLAYNNRERRFGGIKNETKNN